MDYNLLNAVLDGKEGGGMNILEKSLRFIAGLIFLIAVSPFALVVIILFLTKYKMNAYENA